MNTRPEPLLRPPYEYAVALVFAVSAYAFAFAQDKLAITDTTGYWFCAGIAALGTFRLYQGMRLRRYQKRLIRRRPYKIPKIPVSDRRLYMGRGFRWGQMHVQRLKEARSADARKYLRNIDTDSGDPVLHGVGLHEPEKDVWCTLAGRAGHMLVLGATQTGKTRLAELLIGQDILRGDTVIAIDPKGDTELLRRLHYEARCAGRGADFRIFHLRHPTASEAYNPIASYHSPSEIATRIADQLPSRGDSAAFKQFAWRFLNTIAVALHEMREVPDYFKMYDYIESIEPLFQLYHKHLFESLKYKNWQKEVDALENYMETEKIGKTRQHLERQTNAMIAFRKKYGIEDPIAKDLQQVLQYDKIYYDKITASLLPLLNKLKSGSAAALLSPAADQPASRIIKWNDVIARGQIVYVGLDALSNPTVARAVGNAMFADLASAIGRLYANTEGTPVKKRIAIHADEFNDLVGPHLQPLLSKAGAAGVQITAYTQTLADIEASLEGGRPAASQLVGNFNSLVMLRVRTLDTARVLVDQVPKYEVVELVTSAGVSDSSQPDSDVAFNSSTSERLSYSTVPGLEPSDLMRLPQGEAFALLDGGTLWKLRFPLIAARPPGLSIADMMRSAR